MQLEIKPGTDKNCLIFQPYLTKMEPEEYILQCFWKKKHYIINSDCGNLLIHLFIRIKKWKKNYLFFLQAKIQINLT